MGAEYAAALVARLRAEYARAGDPTRAEAMARYMRGLFPFFGVSSPERRAIDRRVLAELGLPADEAALVATARACWEQPEREPQYMACDLLRRRVRHAGPGLLPVCEELITTRSWWDTVDVLAARVVGPLVLAHPELVEEMDRWVEDRDLWLRRAAVLHQLQLGPRTDVARLFSYAERRASEPDFFMRKAIGWALRQYARTDPEAVREFVAAHADELSPLSRREALRRIGG